MHSYNKYLFFFSLLLLLSNHIPSTYSEQCLEPSLFDNRRQPINCPQVDESNLLSSGKTKAFNLEIGDSSMFQISFNCDEAKTPELCNKAKMAFENAATIVTNTFDLKEPVTVNATFAQLCGTFIACQDGQPKPLGAAGPARLIPLTDDDGAVRLFPQALVKQLQLSQHPEFSEFDISAGFNSDNSIFWFRGDPEIGKDQVDFELVLVHEFLHGLGFGISWDDYLNQDNPTILTPTPSFFVSDPDPDNDGTINFTGFQEYVLDKFLVLTKDNSSLVLITDKLNQFAKLKTNFTDEKEFVSEFSKSPQFIEAKEMFNNGVSEGSVAFRFPDDNDNVLIETGLVPFRPGSSFVHLDFNSLSNTTDFLMRFKAPRQVILDDLTSINGNDPDYTNPIGPKTIRMFQTIGYTFKDNPGSFKITANPTIPDSNNSNNSNNTQNNIQSSEPTYNIAVTLNAFTFTTSISFIISILLLL